MPNVHEPPPALPRKRAGPRERRESLPCPEPGTDVAAQAPDEPLASERSQPTPTRTIRDGEIQGHPREMPGDRDSQ